VKIGDVARHRGRIQRELFAADEEIVFLELALERVQRLVEGMARAIDVAFGPEEGEELVARNRTPGRGKEGQQRQPPACRCRADRQGVASDSLDRQSAEGAQPKQVRPPPE
jgi:hypothetical protein